MALSKKVLAKINRIQLVDGAYVYKWIPGQVLGKGEKGFYVKTLDSMIELAKYSYEGMIRIGDWLNMGGNRR